MVWDSRTLWIVLFLLPGAYADAVTPRPEAAVLPAAEALRKARAGGKYEMLLHQFKAPQDAGQFGDFRDVGRREVKEYAGQTDLPHGYWVYVYPCWYIWRDSAVVPKLRRQYGPEQATGMPDTAQAGDLPTAWASQTPDGQDEWLLLEYAEPVLPDAVLVHESHCPGAVTRVTAFRLDGTEVEVWKGKDPTQAGTPRGVSEIPVRVGFKTSRVKLYLESRAVPGYNEIDAVGLREPSGKIHWAANAEASSTYATHQAGVRQLMVIQAGGVQPAAAPAAPPPQPMPDPNRERIEKLEAEVRELKKILKELQEDLKKKK